jgi:hypothetical protein
MISEQTNQRAPTSMTTAGMWPTLGQTRLTALGAAVRRLTAAPCSWARLVVLPYATLREASLLVDRLKERECFEPDRYATESPFLTDSWPRG